MPELLSPTMRIVTRSSKSLAVPFHIRNEFVAGRPTSLVPTMTPSATVHSPGSPSQPVRSLPLKSGTKPSCASAGRQQRESRSKRKRLMGVRHDAFICGEIHLYLRATSKDRWWSSEGGATCPQRASDLRSHLD